MAYTNYIYYGALGLAILSSAILVVLYIAHLRSDHSENDAYRVKQMKSFVKAICLFLIVAGVWR